MRVILNIKTGFKDSSMLRFFSIAFIAAALVQFGGAAHAQEQALEGVWEFDDLERGRTMPPRRLWLKPCDRQFCGRLIQGNTCSETVIYVRQNGGGVFTGRSKEAGMRNLSITMKFETAETIQLTSEDAGFFFFSRRIPAVNDLKRISGEDPVCQGHHDL